MGVDVMTAPRFRSWAVTHAGAIRKHNEDAYVDRPDLGIWAVADGAGGHAAGEVASGMIADALQAIPPGLSAAELLAQRAAGDRADPCGVARRGGEARSGRDGGLDRGGDARAWQLLRLPVGRNSRAYLLRAGVLRQITRDHSLVQELLEAGAIGPDEVDEPSTGKCDHARRGRRAGRVRTR